MVFFDLDTQEKECVGGSCSCPRRSSSFRRKKKSVLGVLGRARSVSRASDARKGMCSGFLGAPAAFFELQIQEKERFGGSRACPRRFWDARFTWSSSWRGKSREAPAPTCPGLSGAASENGDLRGQLQQMRACFGLVGAKISLFYFSQRPNHFILVRQLPALLSCQFTADTATEGGQSSNVPCKHTSF